MAKVIGFSPVWIKRTLVLIFAHGCLCILVEKFEMSLMYICYQVVLGSILYGMMCFCRYLGDLRVFKHH